jgi:hypothetical protein
VDRHHFHDLGTIRVFVLRCRSQQSESLTSSNASTSDTDDLLPQTPVLMNGTHAKAHTLDNPTNTREQEPEQESEPLLGFLYDGPSDSHPYQFGLDGEGYGPPEQKAWSWNPPLPSLPPGLNTVPSNANYVNPYAIPPQWQAPLFNYYLPVNHYAQRRVHFNDQAAQHPDGTNPPDANPNDGTSQGIEHPHQQEPAAPNDQPSKVQDHGSQQNKYAYPTLPHAGLPTASSYGGGYYLGIDPTNPPPATSHQPNVFNPAGYPHWLHAASQTTYAPPAWPTQYAPGQSHWAPPINSTTFQAPNQYSYPQASHSADSHQPIPIQSANNPGGGIWGPPPQQAPPQVPKNNDQPDGQANQDQGGNTEAADAGTEHTCHSGWNDNSNQTWGNEPSNRSWGDEQTTKLNSINADGNQASFATDQNDSWTKPDDWNQPTVNASQTDGTQSWGNSMSNANLQGPAPSNNTSATAGQKLYPLRPVADRPLYGPHGVYYDAHLTSSRATQPVVGEDAPYDVPADTSTTHQVKPGEGYMYAHKRHSPDYIDTLEDPYARFVFKYRTKGTLEVLH